MTREDAITLIDYHYWARDRMLDALEALTPEQYTKDLGEQLQIGARDGRAHLWRGMELVFAMGRPFADRASRTRRHFRTSPRSAPRGRSQEQKVACWSIRWPRPTSWTASCRYRTFDGQEMESAFSQMLQHVVNHATFHRGQVTTMLSQLGAPASEAAGFDQVLSGTRAEFTDDVTSI